MKAALPDTLQVAGVDVGSSAIKIVILEDREGARAQVRVAHSERIRRRDPQKVAAELFERCLAESGLERAELDYVATTGEGELLPFRTPAIGHRSFHHWRQEN